MLPFTLAILAPRIILALVAFGVLGLSIASQSAKRLIDFDQSFYTTIAYDLDRHGVFSNGIFDDVDSTVAVPPMHTNWWRHLLVSIPLA
jgi:hypothetical protein